MPRRPSFRRDTDLQKEIRRVNKLVQNKQSRIRLKNGLETELETVKFKEFNSRKEINKYLKEMNQFLDKKADFKVKNEKGLVYAYQADVIEIEKRLRKVNKQKEEQWDQLKNLEFKHRGVPTGLTVGQQADPTIGMGDPRYSDYKKVKFNWNAYESRGDFERRKKKILDKYDNDWLNRINQLYKDNYLKGIHGQLGWDGRHIFDRVSNMPLNEFIKIFYSENNADIEFLYDQVQARAKIVELERIWGVDA